MYIGKLRTYTRAGNQISNFNPRTIGAVHFSQTGYTHVTLTGTNVNETYELIDGYNLLDFENSTSPSITFTWTGTGTVDWTTLKVYRTDIALINADNYDRPYSYSPVFSIPEAFKYSTQTKINGQFGFEWRYLRWDRVRTLREIFDRHGVLGDPRLLLIPDVHEKDSYNVIITSPFDFYQSIDSNYHGGASGALVFETID